LDGGSLTVGGVGGGGGFAPVVGGSGTALAGSNVIVHVHVAGSVLAEQDLVRTVQQGLLRHGIRNSTSGINYGFG
jgi:hypothetical protein